MSQVDIVIAQEASESTAAIEAAHSKICLLNLAVMHSLTHLSENSTNAYIANTGKMKSMRQHFISELQDERKITLSLESQLVAVR